MKTPIKAFLACAILAALALVWPDSIEPVDRAGSTPAAAPIPAPEPAAPPPVPAAAAQAAMAANAALLSPSVREVYDLVKNGIDESVIRNYISISLKDYALTPEQIIFLKQQGMPDRLVTAMLQHGANLKARERQSDMDKLNLILARLPATPTVVPVAANNPPAVQNALVNPNLPAPPAELPPVVQTFYNALLPHGTWLNHPQQGWVWQPAIARDSSGWRPYSHGGRWLASTQGWYWQSDYSWGSVPFHYGRWTLDSRQGWLWAPDNIWGPSWVTWRMSENYLGWAPLPPGVSWVAGQGLYFSGRLAGVNFNFGVPYNHYTFVPLRQVFNRHPSFVALQPGTVAQIFRHTSVINNIVVGDGNTVINNGIPVERVAAFTSEPVRVVNVRTATDLDSERLDRLAVNDGGLVVFRPTLAQIAPVKAAVMNVGGTNQSVLVSRYAPDNFTIQGRPVYDYSTGVPVLTGYSTTPERQRGGGITIINNINTSGTNVSTTTTTLPDPESAPNSLQSPRRESAPAMIGVSPAPLVQNNTVVHQQVNQQIVRNEVTTVQQSQFGAPQPANRLRGVPVGTSTSRRWNPGFYTQRPFTPPQPVTSVPRPVTTPLSQPNPHTALENPSLLPVRPQTRNTIPVPTTAQAPTTTVNRLKVRVFNPSTGGFTTVER